MLHVAAQPIGGSDLVQHHRGAGRYRRRQRRLFSGRKGRWQQRLGFRCTHAVEGSHSDFHCCCCVSVARSQALFAVLGRRMMTATEVEVAIDAATATGGGKILSAHTPVQPATAASPRSRCCHQLDSSISAMPGAPSGRVEATAMTAAGHRRRQF